MPACQKSSDKIRRDHSADGEQHLLTTIKLFAATGVCMR